MESGYLSERALMNKAYRLKICETLNHLQGSTFLKASFYTDLQFIFKRPLFKCLALKKNKKISSS